MATDRAGGAPVVCVELGSPMLSPRRPEREITYDAARLAAFLRTDRTLRLLYSTPGQLGLVLDAAIALCGDETAPLPPERLGHGRWPTPSADAADLGTGSQGRSRPARCRCARGSRRE